MIFHEVGPNSLASSSRMKADNNLALSAGVVRGLRLNTGFTATEIFRKYLWYLLRERKFDEGAVADLSALRSALAMRDEEVSRLSASFTPRHPDDRRLLHCLQSWAWHLGCGTCCK